jgi:hypothetical protein
LLLVPEKKESRAFISQERDRYRVHVLLYDFPSRKSLWAFMGYYRWVLFQVFWVSWSAFWTGFSLGTGHTFSFWLNLVLTPALVLITAATLHRTVVTMNQQMLRNLKPPPWFH